MRRLLVFLALVITVNKGKSQPPTPGSYITNSDLDKLVGTWKWQSGNNLVEIKLQKFRHTPGSFDTDVIFGSHTYIKDGALMESSMNDFVNIPADPTKRTIYIWFIEGDSIHFEGRIKDLTNNKSNTLAITFIPGSPPQLQFHQEETEGVTSNPNFQYGFTLPADITLIKP